MQWFKAHRAIRTILIMFTFLLLLVVSRLWWINHFAHSNESTIVQGVLDLRENNLDEKTIINLDGKWDFERYSFKQNWTSDISSSQMIDVPHGWNTILNPDDQHSFGYGTYHLRILLPTEEKQVYSIRVPSVRSASMLYVNGELLGQSGEPATNENEYKAYNLPYSTSFTVPQDGIVDIVIFVANFKDTRKSGIVRSLHFGTQEAVSYNTQLSIIMQSLVAIVFMINALYTWIMYMIGNRNKTLLYFSLLMICSTVFITIGSEEKLFSFLIPISYDWNFKIVHIALISVGYTLFMLVSSLFRKPFIKLFSIIKYCYWFYIAITVVSPVPIIIFVQPLPIFFTMLAFLYAIFLIFRLAILEWNNNLFLLLSMLAFSHHFIWWIIMMFTGIKVVYYPFDLIIAVSCIIMLWFKNYTNSMAKLKELTSQLQQSHQTKDAFLANTSHELRNPLHSILNLSQAVLEREEQTVSKQSKNDLEVLLSVGRRMSLLLNDLIDAVSLRENKPRLHQTNFLLQQIIAGIFDMLRYKLAGKKLQLINQIPDHFPPVYGDENRVIQIIYNLLHNGIKFTDSGVVIITAYEKNNAAYVVVKDTGIGMDDEMLGRIFEPYEQVQHQKFIAEGGFGLGLSICKQLVELHGGQLTVTSELGVGTSFTFTLPFSTEGVLQYESIPSIEQLEHIQSTSLIDELALEQKRAQLSLISSKEANTRILVVDDEPANLHVVRSILSFEQYEIVTVSSGEEALQLLDKMEWDLVIADVMMPQMSGYELTRKIRERFSITDLPIILLTARSQSEDIENGFLVGANDYVTKPVETSELRSRVRALTEVKRAIRNQLLMEAAWLQAQIQPHFLFNTLNAVTALSEIDLDRMRELLDVLANFLRSKFQYRNMDKLAPIEEELSLVKAYLYIEEIRFEDRLKVVWDISPYQQILIPMLTIQPLVENAIRHGIMKLAKGGTITIKVKVEDDQAVISVMDNGVGMDPDLLLKLKQTRDHTNTGVGLLNTDLRLNRHFGSGLQIESTLGEGTTVFFRVSHKAGK